MREFETNKIINIDQSREGHIAKQQTRWPYPTLPNWEALVARLQFTLRRLDDEQWIPFDQRERFREACASIIRLARRNGTTLDTVRERVEALAALAFEFNEFTLQSSVLCQIRTLDMELNSHLYPAFADNRLLRAVGADDVSRIKA